MPTDPPVFIDNSPITQVEINQFSDPNQLLARRLAPHLGDGWTATNDKHGTLRALLLGPAGETLVVYVTSRRESWEVVVQGKRPDSIPDAYGRFHWNSIDLPITTPPAQIASRIEANVLPAYREALAEAQAALAADKAEEDRRRQNAEVLAARLGPDWHVRERPDRRTSKPRSYFTIERGQQRKQIFGSFTIEHGVRGTTVALCNVDTDMLDTLVEAVKDNQGADPLRWQKWPKRMKRALMLMHQAGYSIDRIGPVHKHLFGDWIFKMDSHVGVGYPVIAYLRDRPDMIEQVINKLDPEGK